MRISNRLRVVARISLPIADRRFCGDGTRGGEDETLAGSGPGGPRRECGRRADQLAAGLRQPRHERVVDRQQQFARGVDGLVPGQCRRLRRAVRSCQQLRGRQLSQHRAAGWDDQHLAHQPGDRVRVAGAHVLHAHRGRPAAGLRRWAAGARVHVRRVWRARGLLGNPRHQHRERGRRLPAGLDPVRGPARGDRYRPHRLRVHGRTARVGELHRRRHGTRVRRGSGARLARADRGGPVRRAAAASSRSRGGIGHGRPGRRGRGGRAGRRQRSQRHHDVSQRAGDGRAECSRAP